MHAAALDRALAQRGEHGERGGEVVDADDADGGVEWMEGGGEGGVFVEVLEDGGGGGEEGVGG